MRIWEAIDQAFSMRKSGKVYVNEQKKTNSEYSEKSRNFLSLPREANNRERHKKRKRFFFLLLFGLGTLHFSGRSKKSIHGEKKWRT